MTAGAVETGVGVSKAVSLGNSAQTELADILEYFAVDPDTDVALVYVEGVGSGERFRQALERLTVRKPLVLVKGGVADAGKRAAARGGRQRSWRQRMPVAPWKVPG